MEEKLKLAVKILEEILKFDPKTEFVLLSQSEGFAINIYDWRLFGNLVSKFSKSFPKYRSTQIGEDELFEFLSFDIDCVRIVVRLSESEKESFLEMIAIEEIDAVDRVNDGE